MAGRRLRLGPDAPHALRLAVLGGARLGAAGLGSLGMLVVANAAGPVVIGTWALAQAVQGYAQHGAELGLRSVVTAEGGVTLGGPRALIGRYLRLRLAITAVVWIVVTAAVAWVRPEQLGLMAVALASLFLIALQLDWVPLVEGRAEAAAVPLLVRPGVFLVLVLLWPRPIDAIDIAAAFVTGWLAASMASLAMLGRAPPRDATGWPPPSPAAMLRRGLGFGIITLLNQVQLSADLLAVGAALGAREAGVYALALAATTGISVFAQAGSQLALAQARRRGAGELLRMLGGSLAVGVLAGTTLVVAGPLALPWLAGRGFAPAGPLLIWFAPWLLLIHPTGILQSVQKAGSSSLPRRAKNKTHFSSQETNDAPQKSQLGSRWGATSSRSDISSHSTR